MIGVQVPDHKVSKSHSFSFDGSNRSFMYVVYCALVDILVGVLSIPRSWRLATFDIKRMYSRTVIGPWWIVIQDVVYILGLGLLWGILLKETSADFLAYFATGYIIFNLLIGLVTEGSNAFINLAQTTSRIDSRLSPISWFIVFRKFLIFLHSFLALMIVLVLNSYSFSLISFVTIYGFFVIVIFNGFFVSLWIGSLTTRFRDLQPIIDVATRILFFLTPIFWKLDSFAGTPLEAIVRYNPFYYFIEIFRSIVLSSPLDQDMLNTVAVITSINIFLGLSIFTYFRNQIPRLVKI